MHCAEKYLSKAPEEEQKKFRKWCQKLCEAHTIMEYQEYAGLIHALGGLLTGVTAVVLGVS